MESINKSVMFNLADHNQNISLKIMWKEKVQFTIPMTFVGILAVLGVIGNLLVLVIFGGKNKKRTHTIFIIGLAFADFTVCSITLPFEMYEIRNTFSFYSTYACKVFRTFNYFVVILSTFLLINLSIDRYRRVCQPLKVQVTQNMAFFMIFVASVFSACLAWPQLFLCGIQTVYNGQETGYQCSISVDYIGTIYPTIYYNVLLVILIINILTIIILYSFIGRKVVQHLRYRKRFRYTSSKYHKSLRRNLNSLELTNLRGDQASIQSSGTRGSLVRHDQEESSFRITKIALTISIFFVISYVPSIALSFLEGVLGQRYITNTNSASVGFILLAERSFIINHVVNPFVYGFLDVTFRNKCKTILQFRMCKFLYRKL